MTKPKPFSNILQRILKGVGYKRMPCQRTEYPEKLLIPSFLGCFFSSQYLNFRRRGGGKNGFFFPIFKIGLHLILF